MTFITFCKAGRDERGREWVGEGFKSVIVYVFYLVGMPEGTIWRFVCYEDHFLCLGESRG